MGVDVELRRFVQHGTSPKRRTTTVLREVGDPGGVFSELLYRVTHKGRTPMLDRMDQTGTLELHANEMPQLIDELTKLLDISNNELERSALTQIVALARECAAGEDLLLLLVGD